MAHRSSVIQVSPDFNAKHDDSADSDRVVDPMCEKEISKRESRHVLFRNGEAFYFCSRECRQSFMTGAKNKKTAA